MGNLLINKNYKISLLEKAIFGAIFLSFFGVLINFFLPLNQVVNSILFTVIIALSILLKRKILENNYIIFFFVIFFSILIIIYDTVNRPDAYLYHLPYIQILNEEKIVIGLSNLHFRFGHISIVQYLSAINYTLVNDETSVLLPVSALWSLILFFYINDIWKLIVKKENYSIGKIFSVFVLIYISYKINRYSEFGNDAIGHLSLFYLISRFLYHKTGDKYNFFLLCILTSFLIANKIFLSLAAIIPIFIIFKEKIFSIKIFFNFSTIFLFLWLLKNVLISGCVIFPVEKLCLSKLSWTNFSQIKREALSGEAWAKAWPQRVNKKITMKQFNQNFNWIEAWKKEHLPIILKIILPFVFIMLIPFIFSFEKIKRIKIDEKVQITMLFSMFGTVLFFFKFPLYRYGYSYIITLLIAFFLTPYFHFVKIKKIYMFFKISLILCVFAISFKQMIRIYKYYDIRQLIPSVYAYKNNENKFEKKTIDKNFSYYLSDRECMYKYALCTNQHPNNLKYKSSFGYKVLFK